MIQTAGINKSMAGYDQMIRDTQATQHATRKAFDELARRRREHTHDNARVMQPCICRNLTRPPKLIGRDLPTPRLRNTDSGWWPPGKTYVRVLDGYSALQV
jgi:hypothetical protein